MKLSKYNQYKKNSKTPIYKYRNDWCLCQNSCSWNMFWKEDQTSVVGAFENICRVAVRCWYIKDAFAEFCQQILEKKCRRHFRENWQKKTFVTLSRFYPLRSLEVWVYPLKEENLRRRSFSDNAEWSSKKL